MDVLKIARDLQAIVDQLRSDNPDIAKAAISLNAAVVQLAPAPTPSQVFLLHGAHIGGASGYVRVMPTGVLAAGQYRDYPTREKLGLGPCGIMGYAIYLAHNLTPPLIKQATAAFFGFGQTPADVYPLVAAGMKAVDAGRQEDADRMFAEALDREDRRALWADQAELDRQAAAAKLSEGTPWVSGGNTPPAEGETPL